MITRHFLALLFLLLLGRPGVAAVIYNLEHVTGFQPGYGFSGTIVTDGATGSFSDASHITSWNITLNTPAGNDGVATQVLTLANSFLTFTFSTGGTLDISATSLSMPAANGPISLLQFSTTAGQNPNNATEAISIASPDSSSLNPGSILLRDESESVQISQRGLGTLSRITFATAAVPEPSSWCLGMIACLAAGTLRVARRRRSG